MDKSVLRLYPAGEGRNSKERRRHNL